MTSFCGVEKKQGQEQQQKKEQKQVPFECAQGRLSTPCAALRRSAMTVLFIDGLWKQNSGVLSQRFIARFNGSKGLEGEPAGAKAQPCFVALSARLKPCPLTKHELFGRRWSFFRSR
jgi:hypothetical protein